MRPAELRDAPAIADLVGQLGYSTTADTTAGAVEDLLSRDDHALFVSASSDRILGWVHVHIVVRVGGDPFGEVSGLVVDSEARGRGVGTALMEAAETWAGARGVTFMRVRTNERRAEARRFYTNLSYEPVKNQVVFRKPIADGIGS